MKKLARSRLRRSALRSGFTLIELMVVVAILGILTSVAIPMFRSLLLRSKTGEASVNLGVMFKGAASYYNAERGSIGHAGTLQSACTIDDVGPLPATPVAQKQRVLGDVPEFRAIGFSVADYVYFSYGVATETITSACGGSADDRTVYTLYAQGDLNGDAILSMYELAVGSDSNNELYHARGLHIDKELE